MYDFFKNFKLFNIADSFIINLRFFLYSVFDLIVVKVTYEIIAILKNFCAVINLHINQETL